ncbi:hypothetical protein CRE_25293 [Caenorhabditis remanei]|uniref:Uncharacterized protein n=1 Tax=Caenorhabditis remanei TaxID=31234 RepID=E3LSC8_CAERE|nr:hypothetical protein CRE_25293 [Caenorhabditis remanei]
MSNFYQTRVIHSVESPMFFDRFPIKLLVIVVQVVTLLLNIGYMSQPSLERGVFIFEMCINLFLVASIVAFLADYELLMHIHYWAVCVGTIIPLIFWGLAVKDLFSYVFYISMCRRLIKSLGRKYFLPIFNC